VITVRGLDKSYRAVHAVRDLSFDVRPGVVTGFLGPNGAGKSTALRLMLGLDHGRGDTRYDGVPMARIPRPARVVGAVLDATAVHPTRTARNPLRRLAASAGIRSGRVDEVLDLVGLGDAGHRCPGAFSLGMGQRLGLAGALLGDPAHLILDEPANGLDPEGIHWLRALLRDLAAQGRCVLVSSHLLAEMAQLADDLVVIGRGRLILAGTVTDFVARFAPGVAVVRSPHADRLAAVLAAAGVGPLTATPDGALLVGGVDLVTVGEAAARHGLTLHELSWRAASLEDAFLRATGAMTDHRGGRAGARAGGPS